MSLVGISRPQPSKASPRHNILLTIPRTASNLVTKLLNLSAQPSILTHPNDGYLFLPSLSAHFKHNLIGKRADDWSEEQKKAMQAALQEGFDAWVDWIESGERENKGTYIKEHLNWMIDPVAETRFIYPSTSEPIEHSFSSSSLFMASWTASTGSPSTQSSLNPTAIPDAFWLDRVRPTFLIRHPALTFPSLLRTSFHNSNADAPIDSLIHKWECTYHWHRLLYNFYISAKTESNFDSTSNVKGVEYPIILDAKDLGIPELVRLYAEAVGLDPGLVRFEWESATATEIESISNIERRMKSTILSSQGFIRDKTTYDLDLELERAKWKAEFNEALCQRLETLVLDAMDDYNFLTEHRLRA